MGADAPTVSVVLPTRNRAYCLDRAIESVLSQDYEDLELIVVDDGSTDDTLRFLQTIPDPRLRVLQNPVSLGPAGARNRALEVAAGDLIAFQDSDDAWLPGKLGHQVRAMGEAEPRCVVVYGPVDMPVIGRIPGPCDDVRSGELGMVLARYNIVGLPAALVRADALRSVGGFDVRLQRVEDWDLFLALSELGTFEYTDDVMVDVGVGTERVSSREAEAYEALDVILRKHRDLFRGVPALWAAHRMQLMRWSASSRQAGPTAAHLGWLLSRPIGTARALAAHARGGSPLDRKRCLRGR